MDIHTYYIYLYTLYAHAPIAAAAAACLKSAGQGRTGSANTFLRSPRNESENRKTRRERRGYTISWGYSWPEWGEGGNHHHHHNDHRKGQTSAAAPTHRCSISGGRVSSNALRLSIAVCKLQNNRAPQTSSMFRHVRTWLMSAEPKKKEEAAHTSLAKQTTSRIRSVCIRSVCLLNT